MLNKYFKGKGIQISKGSSLKNIKNVDSEIDGLFSLNNYGREKFDFIYTENTIGTTKYDRIIFQEMIFSVKKGGFLVLNLTNFEKIKQLEIIKEIVLVGKNKIRKKEIIYEKENIFAIFEKTAKSLNVNDSIDSWSFGIICNGTRDDNIIKFIESVEKQKIPNYEIIICGKLVDEKAIKKWKNVKYLFFDKLNEKGWITKKKNIICQNAKFENIMVVHDRVILENNWHKNFKKYGNYFNVLECKGVYGKYVTGWTKFRGDSSLKFNPRESIQVVDKMNFYDWSSKICSHGGLSIMKKNIWKICKWDEKRFWNQKEDIDLSFREYEKGIMIRFNPFISVNYLNLRFGLNNVRIVKNSKKDRWFIWEGPIGERAIYKLYLIKQVFLAIVYKIFRINLLEYNFSGKIKKVIKNN